MDQDIDISWIRNISITFTVAWKISIGPSSLVFAVIFTGCLVWRGRMIMIFARHITYITLPIAGTVRDVEETIGNIRETQKWAAESFYGDNKGRNLYFHIIKFNLYDPISKGYTFLKHLGHGKLNQHPYCILNWFTEL